MIRLLQVSHTNKGWHLPIAEQQEETPWRLQRSCPLWQKRFAMRDRPVVPRKRPDF
jgi:hypothetical protein